MRRRDFLASVSLLGLHVDPHLSSNEGFVLYLGNVNRVTPCNSARAACRDVRLRIFRDEDGVERAFGVIGEFVRIGRRAAIYHRPDADKLMTDLCASHREFGDAWVSGRDEFLWADSGDVSMIGRPANDIAERLPRWTSAVGTRDLFHPDFQPIRLDRVAFGLRYAELLDKDDRRDLEIELKAPIAYGWSYKTFDCTLVR